MANAVRHATTEDIPPLVDLLLLDANQRRAEDPILWKVAEDAPDRVESALRSALTAEKQPIRQFWQVFEEAEEITGVIHSMMLPVPPIYAGLFGEPALILSDSFAASDAPEGTVDALVAAAESALKAEGARLLLSSFVAGKVWREVFDRRGYDPLTLYLSRSDIGDEERPSDTRPAVESDVPGIVARSAENRQIQSGIDPFWQSHPDADARFAAWMTRSLTLRDRDMLVMGPPESLSGYVIAQPASRLHFPPTHDISATGVIDDYYHADLADSVALATEGRGATRLLRAAESEFADRGVGSAFAVCPAGWKSKLQVLEAAGYETAMVWSIKRTIDRSSRVN